MNTKLNSAIIYTLQKIIANFSNDFFNSDTSLKSSLILDFNIYN